MWNRLLRDSKIGFLVSKLSLHHKETLNALQHGIWCKNNLLAQFKSLKYIYLKRAAVASDRIMSGVATGL